MDTKVTTSISLSVQITLTETEARALVAIMGYEADGFIRGFYKQMGRHYLEPHAHAVPGLFKSVKEQLNPALCRVDAARTAFKEGK